MWGGRGRINSVFRIGCHWASWTDLTSGVPGEMRPLLLGTSGGYLLAKSALGKQKDSCQWWTTGVRWKRERRED